MLGFNGTINANIGDPKSSGISTNFNYRTGDVNIFNSTGISDRLRIGDAYAYSEYYNGDDDSTFIRDNRDWERENKSLFTNTGLEWYINDKTSVTTSFLVSNSDGNNLNENITFSYDFSVNNKYNELEYSSIGTSLSVNNFVTTFNYIEENNNIGSAHAIENTTSYNFNEGNSILFRTRQNRETDITEYYDLIYEYKNDCLVAGIGYNKSYYTDRELKPTEELMFSIKIIPLTTFNQSVGQ